MNQQLNQDCAICLSLGDICVSCEEQTAAPALAGVKPVVHRYRVVKMLSEDGNKIDYKPHGPWVVMADAHEDYVTRLRAENAALQQRLNVSDQRVDELERKAKLYDQLQRGAELLPEGWMITVEIERDGGGVTLIDPQGNDLDYPSNRESMGDEVEDAIEEALSQQANP